MIDILLMVCHEGFYPIIASGTKPLKEEAQDHLRLNDHVMRVEDRFGNVLAKRTIQ